MTSLNFYEFKKHLGSHDSNDLKSIYFFFGPEKFLIKQALELLKEKIFLTQETLDFNFHNFSASQVPLSKVLETAYTPPLTKTRRLIFYREVELLKKKEEEALVSYIKNPIPSTLLVFISERMVKSKKSLKKNTSLSLNVFQDVCLFEAKTIYEKQIPFWIQFFAKKRKLKIEKKAISFLSQNLSTNLFEIESEIEKISLNFKMQSVQFKDVFEMITKRQTHSPFQLTSMIGEKNLTQALIHLKNLMEKGENPLSLLSLIFRHMRILFEINESKKKKRSLTGQNQKLLKKIPDFFLREYLKQSKLWKESQLSEAFRVLQKTDKKLKSSSLPSSFLMNQLLFEMMEL